MLLLFTAVAVVLIISFACSIMESVLLSLTRPQIALLKRRRRRAGTLINDFKDNMDVPIAAILILNTAAHTIGASVAGASYSSAFDASTLWLFSIVFTILVLLFTEIIPKTLGVSHAPKLAATVAHGINWLTIVLRPAVMLTEKVSRSLRSDVENPITSPEEIRLLATLGRSEGVVGRRTAGMIVGATHFASLNAGDVMLPREEIKLLSSEMSRADVIAVMRASGHSRYPYTPSGEIDDVNGVILVKDLVFWLLAHESEKIDWNSVRKDPLVVPETSPLPKLLRTFQESRRHLAIVVDEYGTIEGIATLEDVLEEIVGDIRDETDLPADDFIECDDGSLIVSATVDLRALSAKLGIYWEPEDEVSSIGGLVVETLERIPLVGESIAWRGFRITVTGADRQRVNLLTVRKE